jgi:23S rRNA (cytosine1962-C5)-methyltransferase
MRSEVLEAAWQKRKNSPESQNTQALRVFHGPTEGSGALENIAIDQFGKHAWITEWESISTSDRGQIAQIISEFLQEKGFLSAVALFRPEKNVPAEPEILLGAPPEAAFAVQEDQARFWIRLLEVKHPGLFLDHRPLRTWLVENARGLKVLNTFSYTGSLSIACGLGKASHVTTLDLSKPTIEWAKNNWSLNQLDAVSSDFIFGDYFEWLPKMAKRGDHFDCVILDPPSYSRGKKGDFSTSRDLVKLHEAALEVLAPGGFLITSLNSANVSKKKYWGEIEQACRSKKIKLSPVADIKLPSSFPIRAQEEPYLKGWILKRS